MTIGERIKQRRKELGVSADDLANALGVSRSTVFRYENGGIAKLPANIIGPLARALRTDEAYLLLGSVSEDPLWEAQYSQACAVLDNPAASFDDRRRAALDIFSGLYVSSLEAVADKPSHPDMGGYIAHLLGQAFWKDRLGPGLHGHFAGHYGVLYGIPEGKTCYMPARGAFGNTVRAAGLRPGMDYSDLPEEDIRRVEDYIKILREKNKGG